MNRYIYSVVYYIFNSNTYSLFSSLPMALKFLNKHK